MNLYQSPLKINLMPHREALRDVRKKEFLTRIVLTILLAGMLVLLAWTLLEKYISNQQEKNAFIVAENKKLDQEIAQITTLQQEIDALKARQKSVEDLQADRNLPVYLFEELAVYVPEGIYLKSIKQEGLRVTITGLAQTQERVSEMLRNFNNSSIWLENPELLEIKLAANTNAKSLERLYDFTISVLAKREKKKNSIPDPVLPKGGKDLKSPPFKPVGISPAKP